MSDQPHARCPHCESQFGYPAMPLLDGTPVFMCAGCNRIATKAEWNRETGANDGS